MVGDAIRAANRLDFSQVAGPRAGCRRQQGSRQTGARVMEQQQVGTLGDAHKFASAANSGIMLLVSTI